MRAPTSHPIPAVAAVCRNHNNVPRKLQKQSLANPLRCCIGMSAHRSHDEFLRVQALEQYGVLRPADSALDEIVRLAAELSACSVAGIALIAADGNFYPSLIGIPSFEPHQAHAPFASTLLAPQILEIQDALFEPEYAPTGIVLGTRGFRFYAGAPLSTPAGVRIGCLFMMDPQPRALTASQANGLAVLGRQVIAQFELSGRDRQMDLAAHAHRRMGSALAVERNFVSAVLDTVGALIVVLDAAGRVVRFNRACELLSGYLFDDMVGGFLWDRLIPQKKWRRQRDSSKRSARAERPTPSRTTGWERTAACAASPGRRRSCSTTTSRSPSSSPPASTSPRSAPPQPPCGRAKRATACWSRDRSAWSAPTT